MYQNCGNCGNCGKLDAHGDLTTYNGCTSSPFLEVKERFTSGDGSQCFSEVRTQPDPRFTPRQHWVSRPKILTKISTGRQVVVGGGVSWKEICKDILRDGTSPVTLARAAKGLCKTANGWVVQVL